VLLKDKEKVMTEQDKSYFRIFRESLDSLNRPIRVVLFADIVGSTQMKSQGVVTWLPTVGKFYDVFAESVEATGGTVLKFLGDGALAEFSDDEAESAINAAILIQESLKEARSHANFFCQCSIGITTGRPVVFPGPAEVNDLIGVEVDKAARLCGAAESGAIWVDTASLAAANMARVTSVVGRALGREADEYTTDEQTIQLKGFPKPVRYREIVWDRQTYGVRSAVVSDIVSSGVANSGPAPIKRPMAADERNWSTGRVVKWDVDRGSGYIAPFGGGADRYFIRAALVDRSGLTVNDEVAFLPRPAVRSGRNETAACVLRIGRVITCQVLDLPPGRDYGFVAVHDANSNRGRLFLPLDARARAGLTQGLTIDVAVRMGRNGVLAELAAEPDKLTA
jgi:class 3 adenylate cyclase